MKVLIDCFGGDNCPQAPVEGALIALEKSKDLNIILCGKQDTIENLLNGKVYDKSRLSIINANEVITNDDSPTLSIRRKKDSSMVVALTQLANNQVDAVVSSGNTGALLAGASLIVKRLDGITRASLSPVVPTMVDNKYSIIVDGGANVDCNASMLKEFAIMGSSFMHCFFGIERPRVGLLNNGAESEKGNTLTKETHEVLSKTKLNFIGNVEARYLLEGITDVVVTDGFAGNMAIKASEGMASAIFGLLKKNIEQGGLRAKLGYILLKPALRKIKRQMSSDTVGGGVFLGVKGVVVKAHGSSNATAFANSALTARTMVDNKVIEKIREDLKEFNE